MKKIISLLIVLALTFSCFSFSYADQDGIGIYIDGVKLETTAEPFNLNGRVMVPMRDIFEAMGATVEWNGEYRQVIAKKGLTRVELLEGTLFITINKKDTYLGYPITKLVDGKTFVPVRAITESLGATVEWVDGNVIITSNKTGYEEYPFVPDFGKMFGVNLHTKTVHEVSSGNVTVSGIIYYYQKSASPKDAIEKYIEALSSLGFEISDYTGAEGVVYAGSENVGVLLMSQQNAHGISVMVPMRLSDLGIEATN